MSRGFIILLVLIVVLIAASSVTAAPILHILERSDDSITIKDIQDREVTIEGPVEKIVVFDAYCQITSTLKAIGAYDKIIGVDLETSKEQFLFPAIEEKNVIGTKAEFDLEALLELDPDVIFDVPLGSEVQQMEDAGLAVVLVSFYPNNQDYFEPCIENVRVLGAIVGAEETANEFADWKKEHLGIIREKVSNLNAGEKVSALYTYEWSDLTVSSSGLKNRFHSVLDFLGAKDVNNNFDVERVILDPKQIIIKNPQFIIFEEMNHMSGYDITDVSAMQHGLSAIRSLPGFETVDAVKNKNIYGLPSILLSGDTWLATIYLAPIFYPDLFSDFDPIAIHQEYVDKYLQLDMDISDDTFIYPRV